MSARERLAREQAALVRALGAGAPVPSGFDASRVHAAAQALLDKRRRGVERAWSALATALGDTLRARFEPWARAHPLSTEPDPLVDGRRFAEALRAEGRLPASMSEPLLDFDARWRLTEDGKAMPRRGFTLVLHREASTRRLLLALRLPGGRVLRWVQGVRPR